MAMAVEATVVDRPVVLVALASAAVVDMAAVSPVVTAEVQPAVVCPRSF